MNCALAIIRLTLLEALRVRLPWIVLIAILAAFGLSRFLDQVALIESGDIQAVVIGAALRATAVFLVIVFVVTSMVRESADKVTELLLSQPISRAAYYWAKLAGYLVLAEVVGLALALPLLLTEPGSGLAWWVVSLMLELAIVASASLFFVLSLGQVAPAIAAAVGFYLLSRSMATVQLIAGAGVGKQSVLSERVVDGVVNALALFLPSLDRMTSGAWFTAPSVQQFGALALQTVVYVALLAAASLFDLYRRNL